MDQLLVIEGALVLALMLGGFQGAGSTGQKLRVAGTILAEQDVYKRQLQMNLYNKYFSRSSSQLFLNSKEREYIQEHPVLKVLVHDGFGPIQYCDGKRPVQGVARELLSSLAQKAGWTLDFVYADDYSEFEQALNEGRADVILSILYDYCLLYTSRCV